MESETKKVADFAMNQPDVVGYICIDQEGLCLVAKGRAVQSMSGVIHQVTQLASCLEPPNTNKTPKKSPVIRVDMDKNKILIQESDSITTALFKS